MARDQPRPLTDSEIEDLRKEMEEQREDIREFLENNGVDVSSWSEATTRADGGE